MLKAWTAAAVLAVVAGAAWAAGAVISDPTPKPQDPVRSPQEQLLAQFLEQGVAVDPVRGIIRLQAQVSSLYEPLEYLLVVQPQGKDYESLLLCEGVSAEALNAAMLMLGVELGRNGSVTAADPAPTLEEIQNGADPSVVVPASGDGFYCYVSWEEEVAGRPEPFCYRAEDLVINARTEGTYQRGKWVYLGSRFVKPHKDAEEIFAAKGEGNLVSLCIFEPANHLLAGADPDSDDEQIWFSNVFLLPSTGHPVTVSFTREPWSGPLQ